ncbi:MAG: diguanylate cyclase [Acidimicrobiia bacterium]
MIADAMTAARQAAAADRRLFVQLPAPLVALTATNHVLDANPALQRWLGHRADAWSGRTLASFVHPADQLRLGRALRDWRGGPVGGHLGVHRIRRADGAHVPATFDVCELPDLVAGRIVLLGDRSALQERERDLRRLRRRLEQFVLDAPVGMFEAAADGSLCFTNARWEQLHRRVGGVQHWADTGHAAERSRLRQLHAEVLGRGPDESVGVSYRLADGSWLRARLLVGADDAQQRCVLGVVEDMSAQQAAERQLVEQALHDPLTGLANRVKLASQLDAALQRHPGRTAVALVDLDGFKAVNDHHGHAAGDALLLHVADRLRDACPGGHTVARLGGDEFAAVLVDVDVDEAATLAASLAEAVRAPFTYGGAVLRAAASVGVAHQVLDGDEPAALLDAADRAMYANKHGTARG